MLNVRAIVYGWMAGAMMGEVVAASASPSDSSSPSPIQNRRSQEPDRSSHEEDFSRLLDKYAQVRLTTDPRTLTENERKMIPLLIEAARHMDDAFWIQAYGNKEALLASIDSPAPRRYAEINYGPWDRLDGDRPFLRGVGKKPDGANFYPHDLTKAEFERYVQDHPERGEALKSPYTMVRRSGWRPQEGQPPAWTELTAIPYHVFFEEQTRAASSKLNEAAALAPDPDLRRYLLLRAQALLDDDYQPSDLAWMDMKDNTLDLVIGPIETYEDGLYGYKASFEAYVLVKDKEWSKRLSRYAKLLPELQEGLPVPDAYKRETPGLDSDLNAYDVIYYAGDCNAGAKTIAINLPNDEEVQLRKGTRRLQLQNAMRAKYEKILLPIADELIHADQRDRVTFDAFFANTMFHEVAHGLGIKNTLDGRGTVRSALKELASALEEGKADILGLHMVTELLDRGILTQGSLEDYYVTFMAGIFRSVRFGASSAHGQANMVRFNFFQKHGAFSRDATSGTYRVHVDKMREAIRALSRRILTLQGDGDYDGVQALMNDQGTIGPKLQADLDRLSEKGIPVDVVFEQGLSALTMD